MQRFNCKGVIDGQSHFQINNISVMKNNSFIRERCSTSQNRGIDELFRFILPNETEPLQSHQFDINHWRIKIMLTC